VSALRSAIVQKLQATGAITALATGGVYPGLPPEDAATFPFISVTAQRAPQAEQVFQEIACEDAIYLVKAIDQSTSPKRVSDLNALIRATLDRATITITGYSSLGALWLGNVEFDEEVDGQIYQHEGSLISLMARAN
jgi:hypothetical protein